MYNTLITLAVGKIFFEQFFLETNHCADLWHAQWHFRWKNAIAGSVLNDIEDFRPFSFWLY